jgi:hypothetical protein
MLTDRLLRKPLWRFYPVKPLSLCLYQKLGALETVLTRFAVLLLFGSVLMSLIDAVDGSSTGT